MAGAIGGALAAFSFQAWHENEKTRKAQHGALIKAQYALAEHVEATGNLERWLATPDVPALQKGFYYMPGTELAVEAEDIAFLLGKHLKAFRLALAAERAFRTAQMHLNQRNQRWAEMHEAGGTPQAIDPATRSFGYSETPKFLAASFIVEVGTHELAESCKKANALCREAIAALGNVIASEQGREGWIVMGKPGEKAPPTQQVI